MKIKEMSFKQLIKEFKFPENEQETNNCKLEILAEIMKRKKEKPPNK